jgi:hypothetical protein
MTHAGIAKEKRELAGITDAMDVNGSLSTV